MNRVLILALGMWLAVCAPAAEPAVATTQELRTVSTWLGEWHDASRHRDLPVKIYYPAEPAPAACPVIVFSHGLGASRETYAYLGRAWAAHGYVSVHLQHPDSDAGVLAGTQRPLRKLQKLKEAAANPDNFVNRPQDVRFAIDELTRLADDPSFPLHGRMDLARLGIAGHSFGAYTVLAVAGQAVGPDRARRYYGPDPRIKAAIAMSSDPALSANLDEAYDRIAIPIFHLTGTRDQIGNGHTEPDDAIIGHATPADRRVAFDHTRHASAYLLTFQDGDHRVFAGERGSFRGGGEHDEAYQRIVCLASTAFWDATLKQDAAARAWFEDGGLAALLAGSGTFEQKHP